MLSLRRLSHYREQDAPVTQEWPSGRGVARLASPIVQRLRGERLLIVAGLSIALLGLAIECYRYVTSGVYLDHIESSVVISGWQYLHGSPLYQMQEGAPAAATYYGPFAYLAELPALILLGPGIAASKATSMAALGVTLALMVVHFVRRAGRSAVPGLFFLAAGLLMFSPKVFWVRPDPIEVLLVAVALVAARGRWGGAWLGLCIGLAVNFKVHAFIYFVPVLLELYWDRRWGGIALAAVASFVAFLLPFLAPGISFPAYLAGLQQQVGGRVPSASDIGAALAWLVVLSWPLMVPLLRPGGSPRDRMYAFSALAVLVVLMYPASFPGSGFYHFLPLLPVMADGYQRLRPDDIAATFAPFLMLLAASVTTSATLRVIGAQRHARPFADAALAVARDSGGKTVEVGYGDNAGSYMASQLARTVLALNGYPALIDAQVLMELRPIGIDGSTRWIPYLTQCRITRWLLPTGEKPFALRSIYDHSRLFSPAFRQAFFSNYTITQTTRGFDAWDCANGQR